MTDAASFVRRCRVPSCGQLHHALGYCKAHYNRLRDDGDVKADVALPSMLRPHTADGLVCDCKAPAHTALGECRACHRVVVHTMTPRLVAKALARWPHLADQQPRRAGTAHSEVGR